MSTGLPLTPVGIMDTGKPLPNLGENDDAPLAGRALLQAQQVDPAKHPAANKADREVDLVTAFTVVLTDSCAVLARCAFRVTHVLNQPLRPSERHRAVFQLAEHLITRRLEDGLAGLQRHVERHRMSTVAALDRPALEPLAVPLRPLIT